MEKFFARIPKRKPPNTAGRHGQAYVELALVIPILLIMLLGLLEVVLYIGRYLDVLDLTREAARFASVRDPFVMANLADVDCSHPEPFHFYYHTACIFSPPAGSPDCTDPDFCNGLNSFVVFDEETDDVVISVFTISNTLVSNSWPQPDGTTLNGVEQSGFWAFSDNDADTAHNGNWQKDCQGNVVRTQPYYTAARVNSDLSTAATTSKGFVAVEFYYCYHQVLNLPLVTTFVPNPLRIHAYTLMPLPAAQPTATPKP